jgi:hypothetical protein
MIQDLHDTGKAIYDQSARLCVRSAQERHKLANLLELIGHLVSDAGQKLKQGQLPASKAQQLELLSEELYFRLAFSLGEIQARALARKLKLGYLAAPVQNEPEHHAQASPHLIMLDEAAHYFLATSDRLRIVS